MGTTQHRYKCCMYSIHQSSSVQISTLFEPAHRPIKTIVATSHHHHQTCSTNHCNHTHANKRGGHHHSKQPLISTHSPLARRQNEHGRFYVQ